MQPLVKRSDPFRISLKDIIRATNNFSDENTIGGGSHGKVYRGELSRPEGVAMFAFRRFDRRSRKMSVEFSNEVDVPSRYRHKNLVSLVGFCMDNDERILIYEYMTRGSLDRYLSDTTKLTWLQRVKICLDVARGLEYLHSSPVINRKNLRLDLKSANILLDVNWQAKLADLGVSEVDELEKIHFAEVSEVTLTFGYADPFLYEYGLLSRESDIYPFGVVLFEVLCGRLVIEKYDGDTPLTTLARRHYENGTLTEIIDPILRKQMNPDSLSIFSDIAYRCLEKERKARPKITNIVKDFETILGLQQEFEKALAIQKVADDLKGRQEDDNDSYKVKNMEHMKIPLDDIMSVTRNFHDDFIIGRGGFGKVYKADIFHFDFKKYSTENGVDRLLTVDLSTYPRRRSTVAIKRLDRKYGQGTAEFLQEISILPYFRHHNLVTLVGFCDELHERILVYEYASNGGLDRYIGSTKSLTWSQRLQICIDAARGLEFLHGVGEHHRIIHRDIKSSNILISRNWTGMISDFGLSRIGPANLQATFVMTQVAGTLEYIDPQYHKTGMLTKESDAYSFGVVLFEVLTGRLARFRIDKSNPEFVPRMAKRCFEQKKIHEIIDPTLKKELMKNESSLFDNVERSPESINIFAAIAYQCLQHKREDRPTMANIVKELEKALKSHVQGVEALRTTLDTIRFATNGFCDVFERGAFGKVYKGELSRSKGQNSVIVMLLDPSHMKGSYGQNFRKKIEMLYNYSHTNLIPLIMFNIELFILFLHFIEMIRYLLFKRLIVPLH